MNWDHKEDEENNDNGRVWTSYSDLFVTVAVVFLVLFLFSSLTSGISQFLSQKKIKEQQEYVDGKLTGNALKEYQKNFDSAQKDLKHLNELKKETRSQQSQLNTLFKGLDTHAKLVEDLLRERKKRETMIAHLKDEMRRAKESEAKMKAAFSRYQTKVEELKRKDKKIVNLQSKNTEILAKLSEVRRESQELRVEKQREEARVQKLSNKTEQLERKLEKVVDQKETLTEENTELSRNLDEFQKENQSLKKDASSLKEQGRGLAGQIEALQGKVKGLEGKLASSPVECDPVEKVAIDKRISRKLAGTPGMTVKSENGSIVLSLDRTFFANDSARLSHQASSLLRTAIPKYASALMKDNHFWKNVKNIEVIGYSSPRYKGKAVSPDLREGEAWSYNLELSQRRAQTIADFFSEIDLGGSSQNKSFRSKVVAEGRGYSSPVPLDSRDLASKDHAAPCGEYDCALSRRVEIVLKMAEDSPDLSEDLKNYLKDNISDNGFGENSTSLTPELDWESLRSIKGREEKWLAEF